MWDWVDHLGGIVFRASVSATVLSSLIVLAMLGCRQPARRIVLARAALLGALVLIPLVGFAPLPRFDLFAALRAWASCRIHCCRWCPAGLRQGCADRGRRGSCWVSIWPAWGPAWPSWPWATGAWAG